MLNIQLLKLRHVHVFFLVNFLAKSFFQQFLLIYKPSVFLSLKYVSVNREIIHIFFLFFRWIFYIQLISSSPVFTSRPLKTNKTSTEKTIIMNTVVWILSFFLVLHRRKWTINKTGTPLSWNMHTSAQLCANIALKRLISAYMSNTANQYSKSIWAKRST